MLRYIQENMNVPTQVMRTPEEVAALNEAAAQQQQLAAIVNAAPQVGKAMKDISEAQNASNQ
jgi:hypothetical protein